VSQLTAGIILAALSVTMYSTGMVLEKYATRRLPSVHARRGLAMIATLTRDPLWVLGFLLLALGLGVQVIALTLAPISIVQAIAASGIALFLTLAHFLLGEKLSKVEYLGLSAMLGSMVLLGLSVGSRNDVATGTSSLLALLSIAVPAIVAGALLFLSTDKLHGATQQGRQLKAPLFGLSSGLLYGVAALGVKQTSTVVKHFGLFDSVPHVLSSFGFYLFLGSTALGFLVFQTALQRTTASVFVPVNNATSSTFFIVTGTLLFHERLPGAEGPLLLRFGSFALILFGLGVLALGRRSETEVSSPQTGEADAPFAPEPASGS
jgi:drug/metabolite transporter (DMT)-like permease